MPPKEPSPSGKDQPEKGPAGPRTPYPVDRPGISDRPGSEPDYLPGSIPGEDLPKM